MSLALRPVVSATLRVKPPGLPAPTTAPPTAPALDESWLERLVKLVPADVVAVYVPALGLGKLTTWPYYALAVAIAATLLVPLLLFLDARSSNEHARPLQYVIRTLAFVAWAILISDPIGARAVNPVVPALAALALPIVGERLLRSRPTR